FLAGGSSGLPPAVEQAIFDRAVDREEHNVEKMVKEAYDEFATRGYTLPPGVLMARTDEIRQKAQLAVNSANRELMIKAAEWELENIKFAVEQGVACENILVNLFTNQAQRVFEGQKFEVQARIDVYRAFVDLFNARQNAYRTAAE